MAEQDPGFFGIAGRSDAITVRSLTKQYGKLTALDNVSFAIPRGQSVAVIGQNGAGKTTLVEIIVNLRKATGGSVSVMGHDVSADPHIISTIGVQLQEAALFPQVRVGRYMKLYSDLYGVPRNYGRLVEQLGLTEHLNKRLSDLSGGLKQRALLAFALINDPEVLILDEPSTGLDPIAREELWSFIENWQREGDRTLLLTSHFMDEVERLCSRVIVIAQGRIVADDGIASLLQGMPDGISTLQGAYSRLVEVV